MSAVATTGCTAETARCAHARNYRRELPDCCRQHLVDISRKVAAAFDTHGVTYWMDYGTLLGAVRNPLTTWADYPWLPQEGRPPGPLAPGVIPHDKDADWGALLSEWGEAVAALRQYCPDLDVTERHSRGMLKIRVSSSNHTNLDIFFWLQRPGPTGVLMARKNYVMALDRFKGRHFDRADLFPLTRIEWEGLSLPAPRDPAAFCEFRYGPNWRTPIAANNDGVGR